MSGAPSHSSAKPQRRSRGRSIGIAVVLILVLVGAAVALLLFRSGWFDTQAAPPSSSEAAPPPSEGEVTPVEFFPQGSAEDNLPYFRQTLETFGAGEQPVNGVNVVDAITAAGFERANMQVSFDHSQTGLVADNIFVSVRIGHQCLIGQVVTDSREAVAVVEPAIGPGSDICLIGNTRSIDW